MRKVLRFCIAGVMLATFMTGCGAAAGGGDNATAAVENTVATEAADEQEAVKNTPGESDAAIEETEPSVEGAILTSGTYEGDSDFIDEDQVLFTDEYGIEFIAQLSDDTKLPEGGLVKGKSYVVAHSEMMTASLPGIYPEVYSIVEAE